MDMGFAAYTHRIPFILALIVLTANTALGAQSRIIESEGYSCLGDDKSRKQTEQAAVEDAKKKAAESIKSHVTSESRVKDFEFESDLIVAYSNAIVTIVRTLENQWYNDPKTGECHRVRIQAEVTPDEKAMERISNRQEVADDPSAPLSIRVWTVKKQYRKGEKIRIFIRGNKPFYAKLLYQDAKGEMLQLLPNPDRKENFFNGGVTYQVPSGEDTFEIEVSPPYGEEKVILHASTVPLGEVEMEKAGGVYRVKTKTGDIGLKTRGVSLKSGKEGGGGGGESAEFAETSAGVMTEKGP